MGLFDQPWTSIFATWFRIQALLVITLVGVLCSIGFSSWQTENSMGDFKVIADEVNWSNFNWDTSVCKATPYMYLSPFKFTFNWAGKSYTNPAYCPWPIGNTTFRLLVACSYFLFNVGVFFNTTFSKMFASPILFMFALLWYSAFVIDAQSLTASTEACLNGFGKGTYFDNLKSNTDFTMICNDIDFGITVGIDLMMFALVFIIWRAWGYCKNRYNEESLIEGGGSSSSSDVIPPTGGLKGPAWASTAINDPKASRV